MICSAAGGHVGCVQRLALCIDKILQTRPPTSPVGTRPCRGVCTDSRADGHRAPRAQLRGGRWTVPSGAARSCLRRACGPLVLHTHVLVSPLTSSHSESLSRCWLDARRLCVDGLLRSSAHWRMELSAFPRWFLRVLCILSIRGYVAAPLHFLNGVF